MVMAVAVVVVVLTEAPAGFRALTMALIPLASRVFLLFVAAAALGLALITLLLNGAFMLVPFVLLLVVVLVLLLLLLVLNAGRDSFIPIAGVFSALIVLAITIGTAAAAAGVGCAATNCFIAPFKCK